jgi:hypothetical protein
VLLLLLLLLLRAVTWPGRVRRHLLVRSAMDVQWEGFSFGGHGSAAAVHCLHAALGMCLAGEVHGCRGYVCL